MNAIARMLSLAGLTVLASSSAFAAAPADVPVAQPAAPVVVPLTATDANSWLDGYLPYALKTDVQRSHGRLSSDRALGE